jgi:hypothetical protein
MAYFDRIGDRLDRGRIAEATLAFCGAGGVGSAVLFELARLGPRKIIVVDGDDYAEENRFRHVLLRRSVGMNKAVALAEFLERETEGIEEIVAIPQYLSEAVSDELIRADLLTPATLVVIATDDVAINRRVALLARQAGIPAVVPAVAPDGRRGEVFVSLTDELPCIVCFDGFRAETDPVRGASFLSSDIQPTVTLTVSACLGILNPRSRDGQLFAPLRQGGPPPQLFRTWAPGSRELGAADDGRTEVRWRRNCPGCRGRSQATRQRERNIESRTAEIRELRNQLAADFAALHAERQRFAPEVQTRLAPHGRMTSQATRHFDWRLAGITVGIALMVAALLVGGYFLLAAFHHELASASTGTIIALILIVFVIGLTQE